MDNEVILYCYTMTHDTGFAPNPYHNILTLATCKPLIRKYAKVGYWIAGWTGNAVHNKQGEVDSRGAGRLIYLAHISEKLSFEEYWEKYPEKRPVGIHDNSQKAKTVCGCSADVKGFEVYNDCGDNIYKPDKNDPSGYTQLKNSHHGEAQKEHDLSGKHVLVCKDFYYFGVENAIEIKKEGRIPRWKKFTSEDASKIIRQVTNRYNFGLYPQAR